MKSPQIYKANALIEASYRLSVYEQRILLLCMSQVRRDTPLTDQMLYKVSAKQIAEATDTQLGTAYQNLKAAAERLFRREVRLYEAPNGKGEPDESMTGWVQQIKYLKSEGAVALRFSTAMVPYLSQLTEQFTRYALSDVAKISSSHSIRIYELLCQWRGIGKREVSVEWLREALALGNRHPRYADLKRAILEPAMGQLNEHTPLWVKYEQRKTGRRVTHLIFTFGEKAVKKEKQLKQDKKIKPEADKPNKLYGIPMSVIEERARPGESYDDAALRILEEARLLLAGAE